MKSDELYFEKV